MKRALLAVSTLLVTLATGTFLSAAHADGPGPLAEPKSDKQAGFPTDLYSWVIPPDNPQTPQKIALGKALFFDDRLSADGKISCDHCHSPAKGFTDQLPTSMGINAQFGQRNAPTSWSIACSKLRFIGSAARRCLPCRTATTKLSDASGERSRLRCGNRRARGNYAAR